MKIYEGKLIAGQIHVAIVCGRFNETITKNLLEGAIDSLLRHGVSEKNITTAWVPGAFEIPLIAQKLAKSKKYDAVICLGAIIRGATAHFDYVAGPVANGIAKISLDNNIPVIFGVLTTNTIEEAIERSGTKAGNKGFESAVAAIEMVNLIKDLGKE